MAETGSPVIIHHGEARPLNGYEIKYLPIEVLPVFVSREAGIKNIRLEDLRKVLDGSVSNRRQPGGSTDNITIVRHAEPLRSKALDFQLGTQKKKVNKKAVLSNSYEGLVNEAIKHNGSIILGLRGIAVRGYRDQIHAISIDNRTPMSGEDYSFRVPLHLYVKSNSADAQIVAHSLVKVAKQRALEDGMNTDTVRACLLAAYSPENGRSGIEQFYALPGAGRKPTRPELFCLPSD